MEKIGKDGINGKDGIDGKDGKDGIGILSIETNKLGNLVIILTDGKKFNLGKIKGLNGANGRNGSDGISIIDTKIENEHLIVILSNGKEIDAGYIGGGGSGTSNYNDLENKPTINNITLQGDKTLHELGIQEEGNYALKSEIPTTLAELTEDTTHRIVTDTEKTTWNNKSNFSGNYEDLTNKPTIPVVPTDVSAFTNDAGYITNPNYYSVTLNPDGTVDTYSSNLNYNIIKENLLNVSKQDYLDILWNTTRFIVKCIEITDTTSGDIKFIADIEYAGIARRMVFTLNSNNVLTTTLITTGEIISNKTNDIISNNLSTEKYPSTKAVFDQFQRKPVVIWESNDPSTYLKGIQADLTASPNWQLTNLDMTPFKRIKVYSCAGQGTGISAGTSTTAAMILEMSLDSRAAISAYNGNYVGSIISQKPNNDNRLATLTCAVSADKTSFVVLRQTNLYGTGATNNNDVNANVFMIEGYYD